MTLQNKIDQARKEGYTDDEIYGFLSPKAKQQGYSDKEIRGYLTQQGLFQEKKKGISISLPKVKIPKSLGGIAKTTLTAPVLAWEALGKTSVAKWHYEGLRRWSTGYWDAVSKGKTEEFQALETQLSKEKRNPIDTLEYFGWAGFLTTVGMTGLKILSSVPMFAKAVSKVRPHLAKSPQELRKLTPETIQSIVASATKKTPLAPIAQQEALAEIKTIMPRIRRISAHITATKSAGGKVEQGVYAELEQLNSRISGLQKVAYTKFAGSVRLEKLPSDVQPVFQQAVEKAPAEVEAYRRGVVSFAQQRLAAEKLKTTIDIDRLQPGDILVAEKTRATFLKIIDEARVAVKSGDKNSFQTVYNHIVKLNGLRSEAGRLLGSARDPMYNANSDIIKSLYDSMEKIDPKNVGELRKFFKTVSEPTAWDKLVEFRGSMLLTSPKTTMRATIGNLIGRIYKPGERLMAGAWENIRHLLTGKPKERFTGEAVADVYGTWKAIPEAFRKGWQSFLHESYTTQSRAAEAMLKGRPSISGLKGKIARAGYIGVRTIDEWCHTLSKQASLHAQAFRQSAKEAKTLKELIYKTADYAKNPTFKMAGEATREALIETQRLKLGSAGQGLSTFVNKQWNPAKLILIFLRTPINLVKHGLTRSPIGILRNIRLIAKAGTPGIRADEIGYMAMAQLMNAYVAYQTVEGNITGCLSYDKNKRKAMIRAGIKPYSIKIGDKYYSYSFAQPLGTQMAVTANIITKIQEGKKLGYESFDKEAAQVGIQTINSLKSLTFLMGVTQFVRAFEMPAVYGKRYVQDFLVSFTPRAAMWTQRVTDPVRRSPETIIEEFKAALPGLSKGVRPALDVFGKPITREETLLQRALLPTYLSEEKKDIVSQELVRLGKPINYPSRQLRGEKMTGDEYNSYLKESGEAIFNTLSNIFNTELYNKLDDFEKIRVIDNVVSLARHIPRWKVLIEQIKTDMEALNEAGAKPEEKAEYLEKRGLRPSASYRSKVTPEEEQERGAKKEWAGNAQRSIVEGTLRNNFEKKNIKWEDVMGDLK